MTVRPRKQEEINAVSRLATAQAGSQSGQAPAAATEMPPPAPVVELWIAAGIGRVDLVKPKIWLQGHVFIGPEQRRELTPERAYIAHGIIVIEELGMWFPLTSVHFGKKI